MAYYHDLITQKSWQVLTELRKNYDFVLIGGWAVWLYTHSMKSKDIDILVNFDQLEKMKRSYDLNKNNRLKKYEAQIEEISIDIYAPYYSDLGIPIEEIIKTKNIIEGFQVPEKETLLILKQKAYKERRLSVKGRKDLIDIFSLMILPDFNWILYKNLLKEYRLIYFAEDLKELIRNTLELTELNFNRHKLSRIKKDIFRKLTS